MNRNKPVKLKDYIKQKIHMLEHEFCINLSAKDRAHFYSLGDELAVDQFAHDIFLREDWNGDGDKEYSEYYMYRH